MLTQSEEKALGISHEILAIFKNGLDASLRSFAEMEFCRLILVQCESLENANEKFIAFSSLNGLCLLFLLLAHRIPRLAPDLLCLLYKKSILCVPRSSSNDPYIHPYTYRKQVGYDFHGDAETWPFLDQYSEERNEEVQVLYKNWESTIKKMKYDVKKA